MYGQGAWPGMYGGDDPLGLGAVHRMHQEVIRQYAARQTSGLRLVTVLPIDRGSRSVCLVLGGLILLTAALRGTGTVVAAAELLDLTGLDPDRVDAVTRDAIPSNPLRIEVVVATWTLALPRAPEGCEWMTLEDALAIAVRPETVAALRVVSKWIDAS